MTASAVPHHLRVDRTVPPTHNPPKRGSTFASFSHVLPEATESYAVIRSSAPGCELSVTTTVPLPVANVVLA